MALPVFGSMMCTAARDEPSQLVPAQRSIAQISPLGPISTPALVPQGVPSGRCALGKPAKAGAIVRTANAAANIIFIVFLPAADGASAGTPSKVWLVAR